MSEDSGKTKKLSLSGGKLTLGTIDASKLRAGSAVGTGRKTVQVEVRRKRAPAAPSRTQTPVATEIPSTSPSTTPVVSRSSATPSTTDDRLTAQERAARVRALQEGLKKPATSSPSDPTDPADKTQDNTGDDVTPIDDSVSAKPASSQDPVAQRRAAELAELEEIEAAEASRRAAERRRVSTQAACM